MASEETETDYKKEIEYWVNQLQNKYQASGQDMVSYLQGLYYADYVNYWDYINLEVLLNLQQPETDFLDEEVFIIYHQVTELLFKLSLHELKQLEAKEDLDWGFFQERLERLVRYFEMLTQSFSIMVEGMEPEQFRKFRMALLPASGFQSVQYRKIELRSTSMHRLVDSEHRERFKGEAASIEDMFQYIYWKYGATELSTGKKTLTLINFEQKYGEELLELAKDMKDSNLWAIFQKLNKRNPAPKEVALAMRKFDLQVNVLWPLAHMRSAGRYLKAEPEVIAATGGTNWTEYLPPKYQKRIFFPELWEKGDIEQWGVKVNT